uniref:Immunoglobulin V-set domain-containing protein n=1 Tax=Gopherus evgoodei TaxID=1825980 RepID=A0A8C4WSM0_9SAUR
MDPRGLVRSTYKLCFIPCSCHLINLCFTGWLRVTSDCKVGVQYPVASPGPRWGRLAVGCLVASGPGMGKVSEPLTLTCTFSRFSINAQYYHWHWLRQPPGEGLESMGWVHPYNGDTRYAPSLQGRITISADTARNQFSLQLRSLTAADTATCYCARSYIVTQTLKMITGPMQADREPQEGKCSRQGRRACFAVEWCRHLRKKQQKKKQINKKANPPQEQQ